MVDETLAILGGLHVLLLGGDLSPRLEIRGVLILGKRHIHDADSDARFLRTGSLCVLAAHFKTRLLNGLES